MRSEYILPPCCIYRASLESGKYDQRCHLVTYKIPETLENSLTY